MSGIDGRMSALLWSMTLTSGWSGLVMVERLHSLFGIGRPLPWMVRPRVGGFEIFLVCIGLWGRQTESTSIKAIGRFEMDIRKWVPGICYAPKWVRRLIAFPCRLILEMTKYGYPDVHLQRYDTHKVWLWRHFEGTDEMRTCTGQTRLLCGQTGCFVVIM
jgi:hypothetical protein